MIYMLSCTDSIPLLKAIYVIKTIVQIICVIAPVLLVIKTTIDLFKTVMSSEEKVLSSVFKRFISSYIAVVIIFMIPGLINAIFSLVDNFDVKEFSACWSITKEELDKRVELKEESCKDLDDYEWDEVTNVCRKVVTNDYSELIEKEKERVKNNATSKVTHLNYIAQTDYPNLPFCSSSNVARSGCGGASFAMVASSYSDSKYDMAYVANWFCSNYPSLTNGGLSNDAVLQTNTLNEFGLQGGILFGNGTYSGTQYNASYGNAILDAVRSGKSVMFGMPRHWAVVGPNEKCDSNHVYLYDPGFSSRNGCYTPQELFSITYNSRNHCSNEGICGWDIGIVLYK